MTIYKSDIKLFESKVNNDESDGGGAMSNVEIISGEHNSIFPDVSDLDRAYGVVNIRSAHLKVDSPNGDAYYGATVGLVETPVDENVEITLMSVNDPYIERDETKDIIERYLTSGVKYQGELFYTQVVGQRAIRIMQYTHRSPPNVGTVLIVRNKDTGFEQYCKLVKVSYEDQSFTTGAGTFNLRIVTCEISEPLRETLSGSTPNPYVSTLAGSEVSETMIANASKYYGMKDLTIDAVFNESVLRVDGIYNQLVPSARIDNAHINVPIVELVNAPTPINASGTEETTLPINLESQSFPIDTDNQGYVFVQTLVPYPTPKTLMVHYIAQGNWYTLQDDGTGILVGADPAHGTGTVDSLGNVSVTLGALPDVTSEIIFQWGSYDIKTALIESDDLVISKETAISVGTIPNNEDMTFTWDDKVATCVGGEITGDATGTVENQEIQFIPNAAPLPNTVVSTTWTDNPGGVIPSYNDDTVIATVFAADQYTFNMGEVKKGSLVLTVSPADYSTLYNRANYTLGSFDVVLHLLSNSSVVHSKVVDGVRTNVLIGAWNKTTGDVTIEKSLLVFDCYNQVWEKKRSHWWKSKNWTVTSRNKVSVACTSLTGDITVRRYVPTTITPPIVAGSFGFTVDDIEIDFEDRGVDILDETVKFTLNSKQYNIVGLTVESADVVVGAFDKITNKITLTDWLTGNDIPTIDTGLYQLSVKQYVQDMVFLTAGNPVANRSLQINAIDAAGVHCTGIADANGVITGDGFEGTIDTVLGIVLLNNDNPVESIDIKYNCVSYNYLPLDSELLGLDPIRLPSDGRVVIFSKGDVVVVHQDETLNITVTIGEVYQLPQVRLASCTTTAGDAVINLDAGTILFPTAGTYDVDYRFEDMALLSYVDISGALRTSRPLSHAYTAGKAKVASLLIAGDLFSRYTNLFDQQSWTGVFSDVLIGTEAPVAYNDTAYPIQVTNDGCATERMAIVFTSSTNFKLIGEHLGQIAVGDVNTDFAPINPVSGIPYFTINKLGWGTGWATNNVLRIDFYGAVYQMNVIRTILQGESQNPVDGDRFTLQFRGNINKVI